MFRKILIPVDLSEHAREAVLAAAELADPEHSIIRLLHVIETLRDVPFEELEEFYGGLEKRAETALSEWAGELGERGLKTDCEIVFGHRAREIIQCADRDQSDLIVLTSHQIDPEQPRSSLGTLSHQIALFASAPVLLLR